MPMQVFEFQADATVSLASTAAINRKSCDHCFLNRKTCDKVRGATDSGDKCKRCAKDGRPCTFTPTVHLYHIADCVGRHQCRAKVIQSMGGRKKEVKFKTIEIPIVCDMDSEADLALFEFIQKQPNLLVYNNRIKSFLAEDILGLSPDHEDRPSILAHLDTPESTNSTESTPHGSKRSFEMDDGRDDGSNGNGSSTQGPHKYRIMALIDAHQSQTQNQTSPQQQQQNQHPRYSQHQKSLSDDQGRQVPRTGTSPRMQPSPYQESQRVSPIPSPSSLSPTEAMNFHQRRHSETLAAASLTSISAGMNTYGGIYQLPLQQPQAQHPYTQQSPYPQAMNFFPQQQQQQQQQQNAYRNNPSPIPSPLAPSPLHGSPHPPSPLELSLSINTNFGTLNNSSQNLPSLFDNSLTMSTQQHHQQQQQHRPARMSIGTSTSPLLMVQDNLNSTASGNGADTMNAPPPLVITTTNEDGNEVGFYYAVPSVNLNPAYSDADLFQDFTMMDPLGEDFVWIENLFDEPTPEETAANMTAMSVAAAAGQLSSSSLSSSVPSAPNGAGTVMPSANGGPITIQTMMNNNSNSGDVSMTSATPVSANAGHGAGGQQSWYNQGFDNRLSDYNLPYMAQAPQQVSSDQRQ